MKLQCFLSEYVLVCFIKEGNVIKCILETMKWQEIKLYDVWTAQQYQSRATEQGQLGVMIAKHVEDPSRRIYEECPGRWQSSEAYLRKSAVFYFVLFDGEKKPPETSQGELNSFVYWLNIEMKDSPAVHSSPIARLVQKMWIKQSAKQIAQMRGGKRR